MSIKMVQEQCLRLKVKFFLGYNMKIVIKWEKLTFGGGKSIAEGTRLGEWANMQMVGELPHPPPPPPQNSYIHFM